MNKTLTITAITLVAVVMGMSAMVPAFAGIEPPPEEEHPACDALWKAYENAGSEKAKQAIWKNIEKLCGAPPDS